MPSTASGTTASGPSRSCKGYFVTGPYDLECTRGKKVLHIEVKGVSGVKDEFIITENEVKTAKSDPTFVLAVVTAARSQKPHLREYTGAQMFERFDLTVVAYTAKPKKSTE